MVAPLIGAGIGAAGSILGGLATLRGGPQPGSVAEEMLREQNREMQQRQAAMASQAVSQGASPGLAQRNAALAGQRASADLASNLAQMRAQEERAQQQRRDRVVGGILQGVSGALASGVQAGTGGQEQPQAAQGPAGQVGIGQTATGLTQGGQPALAASGQALSPQVAEQGAGLGMPQPQGGASPLLAGQQPLQDPRFQLQPGQMQPEQQFGLGTPQLQLAPMFRGGMLR